MAGKNTPKKAEQAQPDEHEPELITEAPMAARPPSTEDRIAALEKTVLKLDAFCTKHNRYHFGGMSQE